MCGITGYVADRRLDGDAMLRTLAHRGPDSSGTVRADVAGRQVFLGHARLSIIDLSDAGRQPMATDDGAVTVVFNGEVYNFEALRAEHLRGRRFRSRTDTEVLLYLYDALGPRFVDHLNGDFALALLDERRGKLLLYRDRLGVKPLYVYRRGGVFAFASEVKPFLAAGLPVTLSEAALQKFFVFKYVPGNDTLLAEVERLPPGCYAELDVATGALQVHRYWQPPLDEPPSDQPYDEAKIELRALLENATRLRLVADVPVGTFLSGGLDSSAIASFLRDRPQITHYCARKSAEDLRKEGTTSDYDHARRLAEAWGLDLRPADIGSAEATRARIRQTVYYADDLIADGSQIPSYLITEAAGRTSRVMLSGMGADEVFLGYAGHLLVLLTAHFDRLPRAVSGRLARAFGGLDQGRGAFKAYRRYLHKFGKYFDRPHLRSAAFAIVGDFENSLGVCRGGEGPVRDFLAGYYAPGADPFASVTRFEVENFLVKNLHYFDRMCMANGVEGRVPFMDHRVVEFGLRLPRRYKLPHLWGSKKILHDAMRDRLPAHVLTRRKAGFGMPLRSIFSERERVDRLLDYDFFAGFPVFDLDHVRAVVGRHLTGEEDNSAIVYALASFQEWYGLFVEGEAHLAGDTVAGRPVLQAGA